MATMVQASLWWGRREVLIPVFKDRYRRHIQPACDYFRELALTKRRSNGSHITYGEDVVLFLTFLERKRVPLTDFSDRTLLEWMEEQAERGVLRGVVSQRLDTVFRFAVWLASHGQDDIVKLPTATYPAGFVFRLSSRPDNSKRGRAHAGIVSALEAFGEEPERQVTPTTDDVAKLAAVVARQPDEEARERNLLLLAWYFEVGLRRTEWNELPLSQIPSFKDIALLTIRTEYQEVVLTVSKGGRPRWVAALPNLLERTREYIDGARQAIVKRFAHIYGRKGPPTQIFLSTKTGLPMNPRAISNLLRALFDEAGVEGHGHRVRATFLTNLFDEEYEADIALINSLDPRYRREVDFEHILRRVAERAGHRDIESLRHYIVILRKRHLRDAGVDTAVALSQLIASRKIALAALDAEVTAAEARLATLQAVQPPVATP